MSPVAVIVLTLVLLLVFIASLIVGSQLLKRARRARRQAFGEAAVARGWAYEAQGSGLAYAFTSKPFRRGKRGRAALNVVSGMLSGRQAISFHYRYSRGTNPDNLSDIYTWFTISVVQLPAEFEPIPAERKSFVIDRDNELIKLVTRRRRLEWCIDGNWLMCWERGVTWSIDELMARMDALDSIIDGSAGRIRAA